MEILPEVFFRSPITQELRRNMVDFGLINKIARFNNKSIMNIEKENKNKTIIRLEDFNCVKLVRQAE